MRRELQQHAQALRFAPTLPRHTEEHDRQHDEEHASDGGFAGDHEELPLCMTIKVSDAALEFLGRRHHLTGRLYDSLGMTWSVTGSFFVAGEFYRKALAFKLDPPSGQVDLPGLAVTHGQLGRLYLQWGLLDQAWKHFEEDLALAERLEDRHGRAQALNHLGQVALRRAELARSAGNEAVARRLADEALGWLAGCVSAAEDEAEHLAAYGRKDRALALVFLGRPDEAADDLARADAVFQSSSFAYGLAQVNVAKGILARLRGEWDESLRLLQSAALHFEPLVPAERTRALLEIARTREAAGEPRPVVLAAYRRALEGAESCRRPHLVGEIERELDRVDPQEGLRSACRRARGRLVTQPTTSLIESVRESGSVLYLDVQGSTQFARERDPEEVMLTVNEMMAGLEAVLRRHTGQISSFRGDGFLALFRGMNHAPRAATAALELIAAIEEFNAPRRQLELGELAVRTGVATGEMCWGNVGTYDKLDFTVVGTPANLGARLEAKARTGGLCISDATRELLGDRFAYSAASPQQDELKGLGTQRFWHVVGRRMP